MSRPILKGSATMELRCLYITTTNGQKQLKGIATTEERSRQMSEKIYEETRCLPFIEIVVPDQMIEQRGFQSLLSNVDKKREENDAEYEY